MVGSKPVILRQQHPDRTAIVVAQQAAGVTARDISYVECHATATNIGDGIELRGLTDAFASTLDKADPDSQRFCAIGSSKETLDMQIVPPV